MRKTRRLFQVGLEPDSRRHEIPQGALQFQIIISAQQLLPPMRGIKSHCDFLVQERLLAICPVAQQPVLPRVHHGEMLPLHLQLV